MQTRRRTVRLWLAGLAALSLWIYLAHFVHPKIKAYYLVPKDRTPRQDFPAAARRGLTAAQRWYFDELQQGSTFTLADPLVETVQTTHPESWYRSEGDRKKLWSMAVDEGFNLTGGSYTDRRYIWMFFLDVDLPSIPPQGLNGATLLLRDDVLKLLKDTPDCAVVATITHELGHAFGVNHPPACDSSRNAPLLPECMSMSYWGYETFPMAHFETEEKRTLARNTAFVPQQPEAAQVDCAKPSESQAP